MRFPRIGGGYDRDVAALTRALDAVRANPRLRRIGWASLTGDVFAGSALGILPAVLREHLGLDEHAASAAFTAGDNPGMFSFVAGVVLAAVLSGVTGFGLVRALTGVGMAATSAGFRRPLLAR